MWKESIAVSVFVDILVEFDKYWFFRSKSKQQFDDETSRLVYRRERKRERAKHQIMQSCKYVLSHQIFKYLNVFKMSHKRVVFNFSWGEGLLVCCLCLFVVWVGLSEKAKRWVAWPIRAHVRANQTSNLILWVKIRNSAKQYFNCISVYLSSISRYPNNMNT